jgi:hypothetical protein
MYAVLADAEAETASDQALRRFLTQDGPGRCGQ